MGCDSTKTKEGTNETLSDDVLTNIKDNLEANLVTQGTLNLELNNIYKKSIENDNNTNENIQNLYSELLINLTCTTNNSDKNDIKNLISVAMNLSSNDIASFHLLIFEKLQGLKNYSNIKQMIERDPSLKNSMKRCRPLLIEIFDKLKSEGITLISQLALDTFKDSCELRGIKMNKNQINSYYSVLKEKPLFGYVPDELNKVFLENMELKNKIELQNVEVKSMFEKIKKTENGINKIELNKLNNLCKEFEINFTENDVKLVHEYLIKDHLGFISYLNNISKGKKEYDETLELKSYKLDIIARIDSQPLPVVNKLQKYY